MHPLYEHISNNLEISHKNSSHIPPHLHKSLECIYVTEGSLVLGVGEELYPMEQHDFAIVFPEIIHHYQVFSPTASKAVYLLASPSLTGKYQPVLQQFCPAYPIIPAASVHPDIRYAVNSLITDPEPQESTVIHAVYMQLILARILPDLELIEKSSAGGHDIIYQVVSYIAGHFTEEISLPSMSRALGISQYALSRVFSKTFGRNFNQYLNEVRLDFACNLLIHTRQSITDVYLNAGFESQRTFNRVFREQFHISPRDYRKSHQTQP